MFVELLLEGHPLGCPLTHDLQGALRQAHCPHTVVDSPGSQAALGNFKSLAFTWERERRTGSWSRPFYSHKSWGNKHCLP